MIACSSKNSKFASSGAGCLQRLAISKALPKERLKEVIEALRDSSGFGLDVQLKILQTLSALTQNYSSNIRGDLLFGLLQVCSTLQASKQASVSNSAAATLQQLIAALFEGLESEDANAHEVPTVATVSSGSEKVLVRPFAHDAFRVFHDLCLLTEGQKPQYLNGVSLPQASGLELIESILSGHALAFDEHPEQANVMRTVLMPFIIRSLSERQSFPVTVRILRVLSAVLRLHISLAPSECEIALSLLNHMLDPDAATPWKRALCMEVFRSIYGDMSVLLQLCSTYEQQSGKKQVLRDNLAIFVRLASEKPSLIGLGQQSTAPSGAAAEERASETASMEATGVAGLITGSNNAASSSGISTHLSTVKTAFLDQLDKTDAPPVPETYVYALVLTCVNNLSDCLAKFILPLTVHREHRGRKRAETYESSEQEELEVPLNSEGTIFSQQPQEGLSRSGSQNRRNVPINPLTLEGHKAIEGIRSVAALIESSWPAVLATCSTFLYASLDNDYYRALVRSFQKFTQVAGLLRMATPRDALLTTLGKAAVPANAIAVSMSPATSVPESPSIFKTSFLSVDSIVSPSSSNEKDRRASADSGPPTLNARNLLCLRALLNIAIALGPTLGKAWDIVCENLQQAEMIMATSTARGSRDPRASFKSPQRADTDVESSQSVASEVNAVQAAATRMFESSADFPDDAFMYLLTALCRLLEEEKPQQSIESNPMSSPNRRQHQRRIGSYSSISINTDSHIQDLVLALRKIGDLATLNIERFTHTQPDTSGWNLLNERLISVFSNGNTANAARRLAAEILSHLIQDSVKASANDDNVHQSTVQQRCFTSLASAVRSLEDPGERPYARDFDAEIHHILLEALRSTVEASGDTLTTGWTEIFGIVLTAFIPHSLPPLPSKGQLSTKATELEEPDITFTHGKIGRAAFDVVQLIFSDFLRMVSEDMLGSLVDIVFCFCVQTDDLNIALTMTGLYWNISDFLQSHESASALSLRLEKLISFAGVAQQIELESSAEPQYIWLRLLQRLIIVTADPRPEVRNTAIHTLYRIFGNSELTAGAWSVCFESVLLRMLDYNVMRHEAISPTESKAREGWVATSKLMLESFSDLLVTNLEAIMQDEHWSVLWESCSERFTAYLGLHLRPIHGIIYADLAKLLSQFSDHQTDFLSEDLVANIWLMYSPVEASPDSQPDTGRSYEAYVQCFKEIYRLFHLRMLYVPPQLETEDVADTETSANAELPGPSMDMFRRLLESSPVSLDLELYQKKRHHDKLGRCVRALTLCVSTSTAAAYGNDTDAVTELQSSVLDCLQDIHKKNRKAQPLLVSTLAQIIAMPFAADEKERSIKRPTFVSLAKAAMDALTGLISELTRDKSDLTSDALILALASLAQPIELKYQWQTQGKAPTLWQRATTTAITVLQHCLQHVQQESTANENKDIQQIWLLVVAISRAIARADCNGIAVPEGVYDDEVTDVRSLASLQALIMPALGSSNISDTTRRLYTSSLFLNSLIHKSEHGEYPPPPAEPLETLYNIRFGRTYSSPPVIRADMAYHCFSELLGLTSAATAVQENIELVALARAAAPYLILRAALPIKAYIADQSLRGRMPQPVSEREELLFVLRKMRELRTEPKAIPEAQGAQSQEKRHLIRLYPLVTKALQVAGRCRGLAKDDELIDEMTRWLDTVGDDFGI